VSTPERNSEALAATRSEDHRHAGETGPTDCSRRRPAPSSRPSTLRHLVRL